MTARRPGGAVHDSSQQPASPGRPLVSARDGLANLRSTEAIAEAARTGRVVETR